MLEDPANFYVVDLASRSSESAGVPEGMQVACCLFLGTCFDSFPALSPDDPTGTEHAAKNLLSRSSMLQMIDAKIGLSRFSELLKRPMAKTSRGEAPAACPPEDLFFTDSYKRFYVRQIDSIRSAIFEFYSGSAPGGGGSSLTAEGQVIKMQKETIAQLEEALRQYQGREAVSPGPGKEASAPDASQEVTAELQKEVTALRQEVGVLQEDLSKERLRCAQVEEAYREKSEVVAGMTVSEAALAQEVEDLRVRLESARRGEEGAIARLKEQQALQGGARGGLGADQEQEHAKLKALLAENERLKREMSAHASGANGVSNSSDGEKDEEILKLKEKVLTLTSAKKSLNEEVDMLHRKLVLLEEELLTPMPYDKVNASKITDLEARNASLKTELWEIESNMSSMKAAMDSELSVLKATIATLMELCEVGDNDYLMPSSEYSDSATLPQLLARKVEACAEILQFVAGRCSDMGEGSGLRFDTMESKAMQRCLEVVQKLCGRVHDAEIKIHEGDRFREQLGAAEVELGELQLSYDSVCAKLEELEEKYAEATQVQSAQAGGGVSEEKAAGLFEKISVLQAALVGKEEELAQLRISLTKSQQQHQADATQIATLNEVMVNLSSQMESMQLAAGGTKEDGAATAELKLLQTELQNTLDENMDLSRKVSALEAKLCVADEVVLDKERAHERMLEELQIYRTQEDTRGQELTAEIKRLEEMRRDMLEQEEATKETITALRAELDWLRSDAESTSAALLESEKERDGLLQQLSVSHRRVRELEAANQESMELLQTHYRLIADKSAKLREFEHALQQAEEQGGEGVEAMMDQLIKLEIQLKGAQDENAHLACKVAAAGVDLGAAREALEEKCREHDGVLMKLEQLQQEMSSLRGVQENASDLQVKLENACEEIAAQATRNFSLTEKVTELEGIVEQLEVQNADIQDRLQAADEAAYTHRTQLREALQEKEGAEGALLKAQEELEEARGLSSGFDAAMEAREEEVLQLQKDLEAARGEVQAGKEAVEEASAEVARLSLLVEESTAEGSKLRTALENKTTEYNRVLEKFLRLKEQMEASGGGVSVAHLKTECARMTQEVSELRGRLQRSEENTEQLVEATNAQAGKIAGYDQIIEALEMEVEKLTEQKEHAEEEARSAIADLRRQMAEQAKHSVPGKGDSVSNCVAALVSFRYG